MGSTYKVSKLISIKLSRLTHSILIRKNATAKTNNKKNINDQRGAREYQVLPPSVEPKQVFAHLNNI